MPSQAWLNHIIEVEGEVDENNEDNDEGNDGLVEEDGKQLTRDVS